MFVGSFVPIIVGRIAIHESVQEKRIEWKSPISRRWCVLVSRPFSRVVEGVNRILVLVKIIFYVGRVVSICMSDRKESRKPEKPNAEQHHYYGYRSERSGNKTQSISQTNGLQMLAEACTEYQTRDME